MSAALYTFSRLSAWAQWAYMLLMAVGVIGLIVALAITDTNSAQREYVAARSLWLADCTDGLAVCAQQWDDGFTLRQIYRDKLRQ